MSHPYHHALSSTRSFPTDDPKAKTRWEDHYPLHHFLDSSKAHLADARHRALYHHKTGIEISKRLPQLKHIPQTTLQEIATQHILEDISYIPSLTQWISPNPPFPNPRWKALLSMPKQMLIEEYRKRATSPQNLKERETLLNILLLPESEDHLFSHPGRLLYFTSPGPYLCETLLGPVLPSKTPTRTLCETLIKETFGKIPSLQDFLKKTRIQAWMYKNAQQLSQALNKNQETMQA
jgi:hypothetical protein